MKVLHINAGLEKGGGLFHIINLLTQAKKAALDAELLTLAEGPVSAAARQAHLKVHTLKTANRYDLSVLLKLVRFINQGGYDIVHTHGARSNLFVSLIRHQIKAKWVITVHSDPLQDFPANWRGRIFTSLNKRALHKADRVLAITAHFAQLLTDQVNLDPTKIRVIYNGIFFHSDFEIPEKYAHPYFNLINVARAEKIKGQDLLLRALKSLHNDNIHLHLVGDGSELAHLKDLARDLGISSQISFHGFLTHQELTELYRKMDFAVLTSYSESFPLVLLEAGDNLVPILATRVGDMERMIPDETHGLIAKVGDVDSIQAQLFKASQFSQQTRNEMAKREKQYLKTHFSMKQQLESILSDYQELLEES